MNTGLAKPIPWYLVYSRRRSRDAWRGPGPIGTLRG